MLFRSARSKWTSGRRRPSSPRRLEVKEELVVKKDVEQRTKTVSDTVRSTEVNVEDERGNRITGTGATDRRS